jgi:hypothetical protein
MGRQLYEDCEYCFLNEYSTYQKSTTTGWEICVYVTCDLLDYYRAPIPGPGRKAANTELTISGTEREERYIQEEILAYADVIATTVSGYMVLAKDVYADYRPEDLG